MHMYIYIHTEWAKSRITVTSLSVSPWQSHFGIWGVVKNKDNEKNLHTVKELQDCISDAFSEIDGDQNLCCTVCQSVLDRYEDYCKVEGGHFEHCVVLCVRVFWTDMKIVARLKVDILSTVLYCVSECFGQIWRLLQGWRWTFWALCCTVCQSVFDRYEDCCKAEGGHLSTVLYCVSECFGQIWRLLQGWWLTFWALCCTVCCSVYRVFWKDMKIVARLKVDMLSAVL